MTLRNWNSSKQYFKNSVCTSKKTKPISLTKINWLMVWKKMFPVYNENHKKPINTNAYLLFVKACGTYSYHWALKG
jgi:hypothetical protein